MREATRAGSNRLSTDIRAEKPGVWSLRLYSPRPS